MQSVPTDVLKFNPSIFDGVLEKIAQLNKKNENTGELPNSGKIYGIILNYDAIEEFLSNYVNSQDLHQRIRTINKDKYELPCPSDNPAISPFKYLYDFRSSANTNTIAPTRTSVLMRSEYSQAYNFLQKKPHLNQPFILLMDAFEQYFDALESAIQAKENLTDIDKKFVTRIGSLKHVGIQNLAFIQELMPAFILKASKQKTLSKTFSDEVKLGLELIEERKATTSITENQNVEKCPFAKMLKQNINSNFMNNIIGQTISAIYTQLNNTATSQPAERSAKIT